MVTNVQCSCSKCLFKNLAIVSYFKGTHFGKAYLQRLRCITTQIHSFEKSVRSKFREIFLGLFQEKKVLGWWNGTWKWGVPPTQFYLVMVQSIWIFQDTPHHLILIDFSSTPDALFPGTALRGNLCIDFPTKSLFIFIHVIFLHIQSVPWWPS